MKKITLTKGQFAIVDDADFEWLNQWKWHYSNGYAARTVKENGVKRTIFMHRLIAETPDGMFTDHINMDTLCNRRSNLRICSHAQNDAYRPKQINNTSGYKGVWWDKKKRKYTAQAGPRKNRKHLGYFSDPRDAARAYDEANRKVFGTFAYLNKVD